MSKIVDFKKYRVKRKKSFIAQNEALLRQFIQGFVQRNFKSSFTLVNSQYLAQRALENETAWDYHDFRDDLKEAITKVYGQLIWDEIQTMPWFDKQWFTPEDIIEECISYYILGETPVANQ
jgi:hypothetical protein